MLYLHEDEVKGFVNKCAIALFLDFHPNIKFSEYIKEDEFAATIGEDDVIVGLLKNLKTGKNNSFFSTYKNKHDDNNNAVSSIDMSLEFLSEYEKYSVNTYEYIINNFFERNWQEKYPPLFKSNTIQLDNNPKWLYKYKGFPECEPNQLPVGCNSCINKCTNPSNQHKWFQDFINGTLVFSNPNSFNDPFDCDCEVPLVHLSKLFSLCFAKERIKYPFPYIHDWVINEVLEDQENKTISLIEFDQELISDIFKKILENEVKNYKFNHYVDVPSLVSKFEHLFCQIKNIKDTFRVLCLTQTYDDILMWGYYGNSGNGLCCEYNNNDLISSTKNAISGNGINCICIYGQVNYSTEKPTYKGKHIDRVDHLFEYIVECVFTKSKVWEHEKEFRYVLLFENPANGPFLVNNTKINQIYQGCAQNCSTMLYKVPPNLYKLTKDGNKYKLR